MDIDDDIIQNLNIELLENVSGKGKDFPYIFRNLPSIINSLNALIQVNLFMNYIYIINTIFI